MRMHCPEGSLTVGTKRGIAGRLLALSVLCLVLRSASGGALEDYVGKPDRSYNWKRDEQKVLEGGDTLTHLELVSQTWRGQFWSHHLMVLRPFELRNPSFALMFITGGSYNGPDEKDLALFQLIADRAGVVVGVLNKVPNQPLYDGRREDALIAYTFDRYLKTGDPSWPLLFPMVKSAVRGMDTLQRFALTEWHQKIERFVVSGASKRGWTTWLTGAVDPRVKAIAPMVIDMLNMKAQLNWAEKVYGRQSDEISDYTQIGLHLQLDDPAMVRLRSWVDPYSYRRRYTMPKLILIGTNDPYWTVDSLRHYWNDLVGPKLIFQTPNAGHDLDGGKDAVVTLAAFIEFVAEGKPLPAVEWAFRDGPTGVTLDLRLNQPAKRVRLWTADSKDRDFRDDKWTSREIPVSQGGTAASADVAKPGEGYRAYLLEATLVSGRGDEFRLSTEARVTPDTQP